MRPGRHLARLHAWLVPAESGQGWVVYLWLIYLAFFFVEWLFRPVSPLEIGLAAATMAAARGAGAAVAADGGPQGPSKPRASGASCSSTTI